jgi:hypothetical protein
LEPYSKNCFEKVKWWNVQYDLFSLTCALFWGDFDGVKGLGPHPNLGYVMPGYTSSWHAIFKINIGDQDKRIKKCFLVHFSHGSESHWPSEFPNLKYKISLSSG